MSQFAARAAIAQRILDEQGYIVVANFAGCAPPVGLICDQPLLLSAKREALPGPFFVQAEATADEFFAQFWKYAPAEVKAHLDEQKVRCLLQGWEFRKVVAE